MFDDSIMQLGALSKDGGSSWQREDTQYHSPIRTSHPWPNHHNQEYPARSNTHLILLSNSHLILLFPGTFFGLHNYDFQGLNFMKNDYPLNKQDKSLPVPNWYNQMGIQSISINF